VKAFSGNHSIKEVASSSKTKRVVTSISARKMLEKRAEKKGSTKVPWKTTMTNELVQIMIKPECHISTSSPLAAQPCCSQLNCNSEDSTQPGSALNLLGKVHSCMLHQNSLTKKALAE